MKTPSLEQMRLALLSQGGQPVKAPVSDLGFYSPTHEAALGIQRKQGNAQAFLNDLRKGGASKEELEHTGIHEFLKTKPTFTKDEVVAHIAKNAPQVKAVVYGGAGSSFKNMNRAEMAAAYERIVGYDPIEDDPHMTDEELRSQLQEYAREAAESDGITEDGRPAPEYNRPELVLPGGQNYREVLLTLDKGKKEISDADIEKWYRDTYGAHIEDDAGPTWRQFRHEFIEDMQNPEREDRFVGAGQYRSSHWDEPNVLAHIRMNDRTDADGKKVLFVEELQSDWGQEGKKKGFAEPIKPVSGLPNHMRVEEDPHYSSGQIHPNLRYRVFDTANNWILSSGSTPEEAKQKGLRVLNEAQERQHQEKNQGTVPSAPFVTNTNDWVNLALKHVMKRAAQEGYDRVAFVNGEQSANRYSLDKHLHSVDARPNGHGGYELRVTPKEGRAETSVHVPEEELENHVGKDLAQKIAGAGGGYFEGNDLKMPHKGMRDFYDKIVPAQAQSLLKKFGGGQMGTVNLVNQTQDFDPDTLANATPEELQKLQAGGVQLPQMGFDITPAMRQALMKPIPYAEGGVVKLADGGPVGGRMPNLAEMKVALSRRANPIEMQNIGVSEAPSMTPKVYMAPEPRRDIIPPAGGAYMRSGMPVGGVDMSRGMPGTQMLPQPLQPQGPQDGSQTGGLPQAPGAFPQGAQPPGMPPGGPQMPGMPMGGAQALQTPSSPVQAPQSNILQMTPQGRALSALGPSNQITQQMADGGNVAPKRMFKIMPAQTPTAKPGAFEGYDPNHPTVPSLAKAFDDAIKHHLSLSPEERIANSIRASEAVGDIIGRNEQGKVKDLLGKNAKLLKSEKGQEEAIKLPDGRGVETTGLALAPAYEQANFNTCPNHHACKAECLGKTSGNYFKLGGGTDLSEFKGPRLNSLLKTHAFLKDPHSFAVKLFDEINDAKAIAAQNGNHLGVRLNVLSDINPKVHKSIIENHPDVTFYDYTKNNKDPIASNHHYTYSSTGVSQPGVDNPHTNWKHMRARLNQGDNVAMAFSHKEHLPEYVHDQETGKKYRVVNGDTHDFRPLDIQPEGQDGVIIGLKNKKATGKVHEAHIDSKGFFVHYDPQLKVKPDGTYERMPSTRISPKTGKPMLGETIPQNRMVNIMKQSRGMIPVSNDKGEPA